ncbi:hypothetical protein BDN72DRAFT_953938 [Pluteus cervinus]|uniref:Uncharacterized protein n=1 Tax=Pluteus cervinus TaxID=181527 RepID=A0ACD3BHW9_9AGAR|nr:hypothetical protein BDN72DRAFT_953938 [Pluteus cervinus]
MSSLPGLPFMILDLDDISSYLSAESPPVRYDDPTTKIWYAYITEAEKYDRKLAQSWKGDMDSILIFAGLFSASVTAFIIESYTTLSPSTDDLTVELLSQVLLQLKANADPSSANQLPATIPDPSTFRPTNSAIICNTLWFLSLSFSLICALAATLVEQWVRNYLQATQTRPIPHERARISAFLYQGLNKFQMASIVNVIPMLLHISLLLFFAGLAEFLRPINAFLSFLIIAILVFCAGLYCLVTLLPIIYTECPYQTPLSSVWWRILCFFLILRRRDHMGNRQPMTCTMSEAMELEATEISEERDERDFKAMCWAIGSLREDSELEPFIEGIPGVIVGIDYSAKILLHRLLRHHDSSIGLGHRIPKLLTTCISGIIVDPILIQKRATTCLTAMWSLTLMSVPTDSFPNALLSRSNLQFDEKALNCIFQVQRKIPSVAHYASSTLAVVTRRLLDVHLDRCSMTQEELENFVRTGHWVQDRESIVRLKLTVHHRPSQLLAILKHNLNSLEQQLTASDGASSVLPFLMMEQLQEYIEELIDMTALTTVPEHASHLASEALNALSRFQRILNQAGFALLLQYTNDILTCPTLPHEVINTMRRLLFRIDLRIPIAPQSQALFITRLDDALERGGGDDTIDGTEKLPAGITNVLFTLVNILSEPGCLVKARQIILWYLQHRPTDEAARKALGVLEETIPVQKMKPEALELLASHMYADTRMEKSSIRGSPSRTRSVGRKSTADTQISQLSSVYSSR